MNANMIFPMMGVPASSQDQYGTYQSMVPPMTAMSVMNEPPMIPQGAPSGDQPAYFANGRLHVTRPGWLPAAPARSTAGRTNGTNMSNTRGKARGLDDLTSGQSPQITDEQMKQIKKKLLPELKRELVGQLEQEEKEKEAVLESKWFGLPENTYGAGIWSILILEVEATDFSLLFRSRDSKDVPMNQRWARMDKLWQRIGVDIFNWFSKRFLPFGRSIFFQLSTVLLAAISWLLQFGFTYYIDAQIGGRTFFGNPNSANICATSGWVQFMSVGFFLAFMLGQVPHLLRNLLLIWTSDKETDESRGEANAKKLWVEGSRQKVKQWLQDANMYTPSMEGMLPGERTTFIHRTYASHILRRCACTLCPLAEGAIIGYLMYVGVKYIFWSGFSSLEGSERSYWPHFEVGDDLLYPWMTNTGGVEEIIMATLALQFIIEIDEAIFTLVLPKSIQNSVSETKLNCKGWLPTSFRRSDFISIGKHEYAKTPPRESQDGENDPVPRSTDPDPTAKGLEEDEEYESSEQWVCGYLRLKVLQQINQTYSLILQEEDLEKKNQAMSQTSSSMLCCAPSLNRHSRNVDMLQSMQIEKEKREQLEKKKARYQRIFDGGYFWKLYCRAMKDTLVIAKMIENIALREGELDSQDKDYKKKRDELRGFKDEVFRNVYLEYDDGSYLWMDLDQKFWEEFNLDEHDKVVDRQALEVFLNEVALSVGNHLLTVAGKDPIMNVKAPGAASMVSGVSNAPTESSSESDTESDEDLEDMGFGLIDDYQIDAEQMQALEQKQAKLERMIQDCNSILNNVIYYEEGNMHKRKLYAAMKRDCSNMVNISEEFVSKPVRHQWMNLLPDATFLLTFILLALPGLLVRYVRARVGCVGFGPVPLDELEELVPLSATEVFDKKWGEITVPLVIVVVIAALSALVLAVNTLKIWRQEEGKEVELGARLHKNQKAKGQAAEPGEGPA